MRLVLTFIGLLAHAACLVCLPSEHHIMQLRSRPRVMKAVMVEPERRRKRDILFNFIKRIKSSKDSKPSDGDERPIEVEPEVVSNVVNAPPVQEIPPVTPAATIAASAPPSNTPSTQARPSDSAEKEMTVECSIADVFDVVTDFEKYPRWVTGLQRVSTRLACSLPSFDCAHLPSHYFEMYPQPHLLDLSS